MTAKIKNKKISASSAGKPKLRFPEFSGKWEEKKLEEIATFQKGKSVSKSDISENGKFNCIRYGELYTKYKEVIRNIKSKTNINVKDLVLSKYNDVIIPASGETQLDIATASCVLKDKVILGGDLNIIRGKENGVFLSYYLNNAKKRDIAKLSQGVSVVHLYSNQLKNLKLNIPKKSEQRKIASFLTTVDEKIEQLRNKKKALEKYKKGIMQKIFSPTCHSRESGNPDSCIRFKDSNGNNFPEWKEKKIGNVCKITTGKLDANAMVKSGKYRFYTCAKDFYKIDSFAFDTEALLISGNGANVGYIHYFKGKFNAYQRTYILDGFNENIFFIKSYLDKYLSNRINKEKKEGNTPYIVLNTLLNMKIRIPLREEQQKIASFLTNLDNKIENINKKLIQAQDFKKGLLRGLFV